MVKIFPVATAIVALLAPHSLAHPGEVHTDEEIAHDLRLRDHYASKSARSLAACGNTLKARALQQRAIARRAATYQKLREKRGIEQRQSYKFRRDLATLEAFELVSHNETSVYSGDSSPSTLFGSTPKCILTPEVTIGPYFVAGELERQDVVQGQDALLTHLDFQFIDTATCEPVSDLIIDIWAANATGSYSGVAASGNGGLDTTFGRGWQTTDSDGVATFESYFPGHYDGRATHQHVIAHAGSTVLANGSYTGGVAQHIGQLFFDETLRSAVEATSPYDTNTNAVTSNDEDMWAPYQAGSGNETYDPFPEFVYLSDDITDGLLLWITIGVDTSANYTAEAAYAATWTADGGVANTDSSLGGTGGGGNGTSSGGNGTMSGNGTMPRGGAPSGTGAATLASESSSPSTSSTSTTSTLSTSTSTTSYSSASSQSTSSSVHTPYSSVEKHSAPTQSYSASHHSDLRHASSERHGVTVTRRY